MGKLITLIFLLLLVLFIYSGNFYNWRILKGLRAILWYLTIKDTIINLYNTDIDTIVTIKKNLRKIKVIYLNQGRTNTLIFIENKLFLSYEQ